MLWPQSRYDSGLPQQYIRNPRTIRKPEGLGSANRKVQDAAIGFRNRVMSFKGS